MYKVLYEVGNQKFWAEAEDRRGVVAILKANGVQDDPNTVVLMDAEDDSSRMVIVPVEDIYAALRGVNTENIFNLIVKKLDLNGSDKVWTTPVGEICCADEETANHIADLLDAMGLNAVTTHDAPMAELSHNIIARYSRVVYVNLRDGERVETSYLLVSENGDEFTVDLTGKFEFNELEVISQLDVSSFDTLSQLLRFLKKMGVEYDEFYDKEGNFLLVGGSHDMAIDENLVGRWLVTEDADTSSCWRVGTC